MSDLSKIARWETLRSLGFASLSGSFTAIGTALEFPSRIIKITNNTDVDLIVSTDGTNDHIFIPTRTASLYDFASNRSNLSGSLDVPQAQRFFAKDNGSAASSGAIYVESVYASRN